MKILGVVSVIWGREASWGYFCYSAGGKHLGVFLLFRGGKHLGVVSVIRGR